MTPEYIKRLKELMDNVAEKANECLIASILDEERDLLTRIHHLKGFIDALE